MKNLSFSLLIFLVFTNSYSQVGVRDVKRIEAVVIQSDSLNTSPNRDYEERIKIRPIQEANNDVEIRFYVHTSLTNTRDLKIIYSNKGNWNGILFRETNYPKIKIRKYSLKAKSGFEELFSLLLENNLTRLPNQEDLKPKMRKVSIRNGVEVEHKLSVTDGEFCTVEFKIGEKFRIYSFHSPEYYSNFYSGVQELKDYVAIKKIFELELIR
jgi:hypothetical protein